MKTFFKYYIIPGFSFITCTIILLSFFAKPYKYYTKKLSFILFIENILNFIFNEFKLIRQGFFKIFLKIIKIYFIYKFIFILNLVIWNFFIPCISTFITIFESNDVIYVPFTKVHKEFFDIAIDPSKYVINNINYRLFFGDVLKNWPIFFYFIFNQFFNIYLFLVCFFYKPKTFLLVLKSFWVYYYIFFFILLKFPIWFTDCIFVFRDIWCFTVILFILLFLFICVFFFKKPFIFLNTNRMFLGELRVEDFELNGKTAIYLASIFFYCLITITFFFYFIGWLPTTDKGYVFISILDPYFIYPKK